MSIAPVIPSTSLAQGLPSAIWSGVDGLAVFPLLPGQEPTIAKTPTTSTEVSTAASGRERPTSYWPYPIWQFSVSYEFLRHKPTKPELFALWEFFLVAKGQFATWLFLDPTDCQVGPVPLLDANWDAESDGRIFDTSGNEVDSSGYFQFGTGDGVTTTFQLSRQVNSFVEPVFAAYGVTVLIAGSPTTSYAYANGKITFPVPPVAGAVLAWSGYFFWGARFDQADVSTEQFANGYWLSKGIKFKSVRV